MTTLLHEAGAIGTIYHRRAVRDYLPDPIPEATVRTLLEAAVQAPTAMHLEPWTFVVVQDKSRLARYSERAKALLKEEIHHSTHNPVAALAARLADPDFNIFYNAGTLILICGKPMGQFVTADCWLAAENLMLAACALGLGSCCIGLAIPALDTREVREELGIPAGVSVVAPIIVGIPAEEPPVVPRKPPEILAWMR
ncbi:MAG TPA: nitroreductase family protein [Gemmatimonadales bacterium]|nr:nitroreductase family protein [Gemmatimonadales bacterium]